LRVRGRLVVFVYADPDDGCGMAKRWKRANTVHAYIVLKVFSAYQTCAAPPSSWHQYSPAVAESSHTPFSFSISPGFWKADEVTPRLDRDLRRWRENVRHMVGARAKWKLVTTFNEWGEGTAVESAREWRSPSRLGDYLDALAANGRSPTSTTISTQPRTAAVSYPKIVAAGDIACDPSSDNFNDGAGTSNSCHQGATSDLFVDKGFAAVLTLGDNQYEEGRLAAYRQSFDPSWGRAMALIHPAPGNHEYLTTDASGYYDYFGAAAGSPTKGYYSFNVGRWHLIALNSNCGEVDGCERGSPQAKWLRADLAAHRRRCTLAYWHHPRFSSGEHGNDADYVAFWRALYRARADVVLNGHDHDYERFAPQTPSGRRDRALGIREFVVGTGGKNHNDFAEIRRHSVVRNADTFGVLRLTLRPRSYRWRFLPEAGESFADSGRSRCH
jgi:acid phosphatase type 7